MSSYVSESLYSLTNTVENFRNYFESPQIPYDSTDFTYIVPLKYANKPGLLAYDLYGSERYNWVISYFNRDTINDIIWDLNEGVKIRLPQRERLLQYVG